MSEKHSQEAATGESTVYVITWRDAEYGYPVFESLVLGPPGQKLEGLYFEFRDDIFLTALGRPFKSMGPDDEMGAVTQAEVPKLRAIGYYPLVRDWLDTDPDERGYALMQFSRCRNAFVGWLCKHRGFTLPSSVDIQGVDFWEYRKWHEDYRD